MTQAATQTTAQQLKAYIDRIERLEEDKKGVSTDIRDIYSEASGNGFDKKALASIVKLRRKTKAERDEEQQLIDTYLAAIEGGTV